MRLITVVCTASADSFIIQFIAVNRYRLIQRRAESGVGNLWVDKWSMSASLVSDAKVLGIPLWVPSTTI